MSEDELLDLVDNDDNVVGTQWRLQAHANNLHNFRVIKHLLSMMKENYGSHGAHRQKDFTRTV